MKVIQAVFLCLCFMLLTLSSAQTYQLILDGEDPVLEVDTTQWFLDKTSTYNRSFKFSAAGPGTGDAKAVWSIDGIPSGNYYVEFFVDNGGYASTAEYIIEDDYGLSTVIRSQYNRGTTQWFSLATCQFINAGRITQTNHWTGSGTKVIADALRITFLGTPALPTIDVCSPAMTICIDDLGALNPNDTTSFTGQFFASCTEFTYAVFPDNPYTLSTLQAASTKRIETILHQAMQYVGQSDYVASDTVRLYTGMTDSQITTVLTRNLQIEFPYVQGINNHQGSRFSEYGHGMQLVADVLKNKGMFLYDSRTITDSVAYDIARRTGILSAERDLFIDGNTIQETKDYVLSICSAAIYSPNYNYLCIGHQRTNTVPALIQLMPVIRTMGIQLRPVSRNLSYIMETDVLPTGAQLQLSGAWDTTAQDMISTECYDGNAFTHTGTTFASAKFIPSLPRSGQYQAFVGFTSGTLNCDSVKITVHETSGDKTFCLNQSQEPNRWHYIGSYSLSSGTQSYLQVDNSLCTSPSHQTRVDSVKFVYLGAVVLPVQDWYLY